MACDALLVLVTISHLFEGLECDVIEGLALLASINLVHGKIVSCLTANFSI